MTARRCAVKWLKESTCYVKLSEEFEEPGHACINDSRILGALFGLFNMSVGSQQPGCVCREFSILAVVLWFIGLYQITIFTTKFVVHL